MFKIFIRLWADIRVCLAISLFIVFSFGPIYGQTNNEDDNIILILSSYMSDSRRVTDFVTEFTSINNTEYSTSNILMENMNYLGLDGINQWKDEMRQTLAKHDYSKLRGIILLGQEAWASYLSLDSVPDVPYFGCYVSRNGLSLSLIPNNPNEWTPKVIDTENRAKELGNGGGVINIYDVKTNIELILELFPDTKHIAFLSDNSYGGISMQASVIKYFNEQQFPDLNLILLDGRKDDVNTIINQIDRLPENTVMLAGTWRVDNNGLYFLQSTLSSLVEQRPNLPIFSMSSLGYGSVTIGGYTPIYQVNAKFIIDKINSFYNGTWDSNSFFHTNSEYTFYEDQLQKFGIKKSALPSSSTIISSAESSLNKYKNYLLLSTVIIFMTLLIVLVISFFYVKTNRMKQKLVINEKALIKAKEKAERSEQLKSAFLANMSHEIRTPLNAIVGFSSLMCENISNQDKERYSSIINTNSNLLLGLISDILDLSRLESNNMVFHFKDEDILPICQEAMQSIEHQKKKNIEYLIKPGINPFFLNTDKYRLLQVLVNFLTNANKYTEKGSITLSYDVDEAQNRVYIAVTDTGSGIPNNQQEVVFNRFSKLDDFKQGTGLGLSICKQISLKFGAEIYVDKNYQDGSRFVLAHPIRRQ